MQQEPIDNFERPFNVLMIETGQLNRELEQVYTRFGAILDRMETTAGRIHAETRVASRQMFKSFIDQGCIPGAFIHFLGKYSDLVYAVVGIDSEGFWLRQLPSGIEYHLDVIRHQDRAHRVRPLRLHGKMVQQALADAMPEMKKGIPSLPEKMPVAPLTPQYPFQQYDSPPPYDAPQKDATEFAELQKDDGQSSSEEDSSSSDDEELPLSPSSNGQDVSSPSAPSTGN